MPARILTIFGSRLVDFKHVQQIISAVRPIKNSDNWKKQKNIENVKQILVFRKSLEARSRLIVQIINTKLHYWRSSIPTVTNCLDEQTIFKFHFVLYINRVKRNVKTLTIISEWNENFKSTGKLWMPHSYGSLLDGKEAILLEDDTKCDFNFFHCKTHSDTITGTHSERHVSIRI